MRCAKTVSGFLPLAEWNLLAARSTVQGVSKKSGTLDFFKSGGRSTRTFHYRQLTEPSLAHVNRSYADRTQGKRAWRQSFRAWLKIGSRV